MPRFVAVYTMKPEDVAAFRARPKSKQEATDKAGLKAWEEWGKRNAAAIVASDVMVGKTRRVTKSGIADAQNQIAGFLIVEAADVAAALAKILNFYTQNAGDAGHSGYTDAGFMRGLTADVTPERITDMPLWHSIHDRYPVAAFTRPQVKRIGNCIACHG